jgi:ABC-2 type transport system permease protein
VSGSIALAMDIEIGFIDRLFAAPIARSAIVMGRLAATAVLGLVSAAWFLGLGLVFGAHIKGGVGGVIVVVVLLALNAAAFGSLGAALALKSGSPSVAQGVFPIVFVILFLSSAYFPRNLLLEPAKTIADWNPLSLIAESLRDPIVSGLTWDATLKGLGGIAIIAGVGVFLSAASLRSRLRAG